MEKKLKEEKPTEEKPTEEKIIQKKKKRLDKRTVGIVLLIELGLLVFLALAAFVLIKTEKARQLPKRTETTWSTVPEETPAATPLPNFHAPETAPDAQALGIRESVRAENPGAFGAEYWVDITPEGMEGYTVLRHISLGMSYLIRPDGSSVSLGEESEGCGAVSALYLDLDGDESYELLYTYTVTGENGTGCAVGWLDLATGRQQTAPFRLSKGTWALRSEEGCAILYTATLSSTESLGYYELVPGTDIGEVIEQEGALTLLVGRG